MNIRKDIVFAALIGATLSTVGCVAFLNRDTPRDLAPATPPKHNVVFKEPTPIVPAVKDSLPTADTAASPAETPRSRRVTRQAKAADSGSVAAAQTPHSPLTAKRTPVPSNASTPMPEARVPQMAAPARTISAEEARAALREVGLNAEAEALWMTAINDPNLPAEQRKDLIEDLNEEGFPDPKHLTAADLPRVENRLALIEELAPDALDQTNADAFQEAYKDLTNMQNRLKQP